MPNEIERDREGASKLWFATPPSSWGGLRILGGRAYLAVCSLHQARPYHMASWEVPEQQDSIWDYRDAVIEGIKAQQTTGSVLFVEGEGINHVRRFGLACHVGLETGKPTIAVRGADTNVRFGRGTFTSHTADNMGTTSRLFWSQDDKLPLEVSLGCGHVNWDLAHKYLVQTTAHSHWPVPLEYLRHTV